MQKILRPWAEDGTKVAMTDSEISAGWQPNDQPASENWNDIQYVRDAALNTDAEARAVRHFGINPSTLKNNDTTRYPVFRPQPFAGKEALWNPENVCNRALIEDGSRCYFSALGWNPLRNQPIIAVQTENSLIFDQSTGEIAVVNCWDYNNTVNLDSLTLNFGFAVRDEQNPMVICDGYLYIVIHRQTTGAPIYVQRYNLAEWTGYPETSLSLSGASGLDTYAKKITEAVETTNGIGFFVQNQTSNQNLYFLHCQKNLGAYTISAASETAVPYINRLCKTDGNWVVTAGYDNGENPVIVRADLSQVTAAPLVYESGASYANRAIVDMVILRSGSDHSESSVTVACLMHKAVAPYGPFIQIADFYFVGGETPAWGFVPDVVFNFGDASFDYSIPGTFCMFGAQFFTILNREIDLGESSSFFADLVKINPGNLIPPGSGIQSYCRNLTDNGIRIGDELTAEYSDASTDSLIHARAHHDGRSIWLIDFAAGTVRRIVAPETRCGV